MRAEEAFYARAMARVYRGLWIVTAAGSLAAFVFAGWLWALAFALGATGGCFSFRWLHQAVDSLGPGSRAPRKRVIVFAGLRYLILGLGGYVIVRVFGINAIGALTGLFVPVAAVVLEVLYELVHERA